MRTPATGRTPVATVKGYTLHKKGSPLSETFNAAVVMSNSTAFAGEVKRTINQSGILSNSREQAFKVTVQNAPLEYVEREDETGGSELPSVTSATGPERSPRSLRLSRLIQLGGRRSVSRPHQGAMQDCKSQKGGRLKKKGIWRS